MVLQIKECSVLIDDEDYEKIKDRGWTLLRATQKKTGKYYFVTCMTTERNNHHNIYLHRFIMGNPSGLFVDHANGNTLDCRKCNLRICTRTENTRNQKIQKHNTTGYKGASFIKRTGKYHSSIRRGDEPRLSLGYFNTAIEAHTAYCEASKKYHGEFGRTE
jgi:hypothetical protein